MNSMSFPLRSDILNKGLTLFSIVRFIFIGECNLIFNFFHRFLNSRIPFPSPWAISVIFFDPNSKRTYDQNNKEFSHFHISNILIFLFVFFLFIINGWLIVIVAFFNSLFKFFYACPIPLQDLVFSWLRKEPE